jgi:hypothetical protein
MKAMVVVLSPSAHGYASSDVARAIPAPELLSRLAVLNRANNDLGPREPDPAPPPLWTWFIENPRQPAV